MAAEKKTGSPLTDELRALLAEFFGTFALTFVAAGGLVIKEVSHDQVEYAARVAAPGLLVMAIIYTLGDISGAHINPAVTLAFALRRDFSWARVPGYWLAQLLGACSAPLVLLAIFGNVAHLGATMPHFGDVPAFAMEILLTVLLVSVIVGTSQGSKIVGPNAGIAVGGTIALCGLFADPISGASMNPARSLGPALVSGELSQVWIYILGPLLGSVIAVILAWLMKGAPTQKEAEAASGEKHSEQGSEESSKAEADTSATPDPKQRHNGKNTSKTEVPA